MKLDQWFATANQRLGVDIKAAVAFDGNASQSDLDFNGSNPSSSNMMRENLGRDDFHIFIAKKISTEIYQESGNV